jgi:hypothetical protein
METQNEGKEIKLVVRENFCMDDAYCFFCGRHIEPARGPFIFVEGTTPEHKACEVCANYHAPGIVDELTRTLREFSRGLYVDAPRLEQADA